MLSYTQPNIISIELALWPEKVFNIGVGGLEPVVVTHGNETVKLVLWSTSSGILLQRIKHF